MLIYLLIAAELGILYTIFWYVYIKEPKPFSLSFKNNPWGKYGDTGFTAGGIDPTLPFAQRLPGESTPGQGSNNGNPAPQPPWGLIHGRVSGRRIRRHRLKIRLLPKRRSRNLFFKVISLFSKTIDGLNVKQP